MTGKTRTGHNNLSVEIFDSLTGGKHIADADGNLSNIGNLRYSTGYPGGTFLDATFDVPRDVSRAWEVKGGKRIVIRDGLTVVYEGTISNIQHRLGRNEQNTGITAVGFWGSLLGTNRWRKHFSDARLSEWKQTENDEWRAFDVNRSTSALEVYPKDGVSYTSGSKIEFGRYIMPIGSGCITRITFAPELREGGQAWKLALWNSCAGFDSWSACAPGTSSVVISASNLVGASTTDTVVFYFHAEATQTGNGNGSTFGHVHAIGIDSSSASEISLTTIAQDVITHMSGSLSSSSALIASNTRTFGPFVTDRWEPIADILMRAAKYGDASANAWAVGVRESDRSTDSLPILFTERQPALTDYDYTVNLNDDNVEPPFSISQDVDDLFNWIIISYRDQEGEQQFLTPETDSTLTSASSVSAYGERHSPAIDISLGNSSKAACAGQAILGQRKDPQWHMAGPIRVKGFIRGKSDQMIPVSHVRAGKRVKIENFLSDLSGTGLTMLITHTDYDDPSETVSITAGIPDRLDILLAQAELAQDRGGQGSGALR